MRSLASDAVRVREVEATARQIGREIAPGAQNGPAEPRMRQVPVSLGFQRERTPAAGDRLTYVLRNCPYREAVRERQPLVCGPHRRLTRGMLDVLDTKTELVGFVPYDPDTAGCLIQLRGRMAAEASDVAA